MKSFFGLMGSNRNGEARLYSGLHPRIPLMRFLARKPALKVAVWMPMLLVDLLMPDYRLFGCELHDWVLVRPLTATGRAFRLSRLRMTFNRHVFERVEH